MQHPANWTPFSRSLFRWIALFCAAVRLVALPVPLAVGEPAFSRSFDGPQTSWLPLENGIASKLLVHGCIPGGARDTKGIERIAVAAPAGYSVLFHCPTPPLAVLDELQIRMWVKSDRGGIRLGARVVMPRSADPTDPTKARTLVFGTDYTRAGQWQELVFSQVPKLLAEQVRVLRTVPGSKADATEAYVDAVVVMVPGDPNGLEIGTDQLSIEGIRLDEARLTASLPAAGASSLSNSSVGNAIATSAAEPRDRTFPSGTRTRGSGSTTGSLVTASSPVHDEHAFTARLQGTQLLVNERAFFPRAIEWNGEPFELLAGLGFNVVMLPQPPTAEQVAEGSRHGIWFVCIPPRFESITRDGIGAFDDRVIAWRLEDEAIDSDPGYALRWVNAIRERDVVYGRPIMVSPRTTWRYAGKAGDILLAEHPRLTRLNESEIESWLAEQPRSMRPGTPIWVSVPTQLGEIAQAQLSALGHDAAPGASLDSDTLEAALRVAERSGVRGVVFRSRSPLTAPDTPTRLRGALLNRVNAQLQLIGPWLAGGKIVSRAVSLDGRSEGIVLQVDRARLLIPFAKSVSGVDPPSKRNATPRRAEEWTFLVPGISETSQMFLLTPVSLERLEASAVQRVAGGTRIELASGEGAMALITEDPQVIQGLRARVAKGAAAYLKLRQDALAGSTQSVIEVDQRLVQLGRKASQDATQFAAMNAKIGQANQLLSAGRFDESYRVEQSLLREIGQVVKDHERAAGLAEGLQSNALGLTYRRWGDFAALQRSFEELRGGDNLLPGGDFENLAEITQLGWRHVRTAAEAEAESQLVEAEAELSSRSPQQGTYCLELRAKPRSASAEGAALNLTSPQLWITSPSMPLEAGQTVEISGWVRIEQPFATPGAGLEILDTLGGPELAIVVPKTSGWQMFRLVRAAPRAANLQVTFALIGSGSAQVDGVMVRAPLRPVARRLPAVAPPPTVADGIAR